MTTLPGRAHMVGGAGAKALQRCLESPRFQQDAAQLPPISQFSIRLPLLRWRKGRAPVRVCQRAFRPARLLAVARRQ